MALKFDTNTILKGEKNKRAKSLAVRTAIGPSNTGRRLNPQSPSLNPAHNTTTKRTKRKGRHFRIFSAKEEAVLQTLQWLFASTDLVALRRTQSWWPLVICMCPRRASCSTEHSPLSAEARIYHSNTRREQQSAKEEYITQYGLHYTSVQACWAQF